MDYPAVSSLGQGHPCTKCKGCHGFQGGGFFQKSGTLGYYHSRIAFMDSMDVQ